MKTFVSDPQNACLQIADNLFKSVEQNNNVYYSPGTDVDGMLC